MNLFYRDVNICLSPEKRSERLSCDNHWTENIERQDLDSGEEGEVIN